MEFSQNLVLFGAAALAGAVNAVAGGGTLLTFPALLWVGQVELVANATSTVALWPGQIGSLWAYREELGRSRPVIAVLAVPSVIGGLLGANLLLHTDPAIFQKVVPWLILLATLLFAAQEPLARWQKRRAEQTRAERAMHPVSTDSSPADTPFVLPTGLPLLGIVGFQLLVGIYGGYFGAGIGIMMLAALAFMGFTNIHQMNGLKNINALFINMVAAIQFMGKGIVDWRVAGMMAVGAIVGGYTGAGTARRLGQANVRRVVIGIGILVALSLLFRR